MSAPGFDAGSVSLTGKHLVEASAGTGKTHAITTLFVRLVVERGLLPAEIVVVTFTEAATAELRDRVRRRLVEAEAAFEASLAGTTAVGDATLLGLVARRKGHAAEDAARLRDAIENVDQAAISTIHSFCQSTLKDAALTTRTSFDVELVPDLNDIRDDALYDFWHRAVAPDDVLVELLHSQGIDIRVLRTLLTEVLRNPTATLEPPLLAPGEGGALGEGAVLAERTRAALLAARAAGKGLAINEYLKPRCTLQEILFNSSKRSAMFKEVEGVIEGHRHSPPANSERLFPAVVNAAAKVPKAKRTSKGKAPQEADLSAPPGAHPFFPAWENYVRACQERLLLLQTQLLRDVPRDIARRKQRLGVLGFEDLIRGVADALQGPSGEQLAANLRKKFKAVLIDEFQDTDPTQLDIFRQAFGDGKHTLFFIGDPKQAIYGFRGGDVFTYLQGRQGAERHVMSVNWRSDPGVLQAVNEMFRKPDIFLNEDILYEPVQARPGAARAFLDANGAPQAGVEILFVEDGNRESVGRARGDASRIVAADIVRLLRGGERIPDGSGSSRPVREGDIAVLTRNNRQCVTVQEALVARGVHCVLAGDQNVFGAAETKELLLVLGAVLDPSSTYELKRALSSRIVGLRGKDIARLESDASEWNEWVEGFRRWQSLWAQHGFLRMFRELLRKADTVKTLLRSRDGERSLTNLLHLGELMHQASKAQQLGPAALVQWLEAERRAADQPRAAREETAEMRLESDESAVHILTIHKAKGLEYPVVYLPYLWNKFSPPKNHHSPLLHHPSGQPVLNIALDGADRSAALAGAAKENEAEERRVLYVALTRAKHRCTILWGHLKGMLDSTAASLFHPSGLDQSATEAEILRDLEALRERCGQDLSLRTVPKNFDQAPLEPRSHDAATLHPRKIEHVVRQWVRTDSFSGLIRPRAEIDPHEIAPSEDEHLADIAGSAHLPVTVVSSPAPLGVLGSDILLKSFPRGANPGDFFHKVFESIDFASVTPQELAAVVQVQFDAYGIGSNQAESERARLRALAVQAVTDTLDTPLFAHTALRLRDVTAKRRFCEMSFHVPVLGQLRANKLSRAFCDPFSSPELPAEYHHEVGALPFRSLQGFLHGVIDLVFEHAGKWYVVDYKSNYLGDTLGEYGVTAMTKKMASSHYFLQYHLYVLGVDRYLRQWQPGYSYERDFGGVLYLFLKGMHPASGASTGVFFEKPPAARIQFLSDALGTEAAWK